MTAVEYDDYTRRSARFLEEREAMRTRSPLATARKVLARRLGIPPGTLEGIRKRRTKGVRAWVAERIRAAMVAELEASIERMQHELAMAQARGVDPAESVVARAEASIREAKSLIADAVAGTGAE